MGWLDRSIGTALAILREQSAIDYFEFTLLFFLWFRHGRDRNSLRCWGCKTRVYIQGMETRKEAEVQEAEVQEVEEVEEVREVEEVEEGALKNYDTTAWSGEFLTPEADLVRMRRVSTDVTFQQPKG